MSFETFERHFVKPRAGRTLIVGSRVYNDKPDRRRRYPTGSVVGVDMLPGEGADVVLDMEGPVSLADFGGDLFDHVECLSVLEHSRRPWLVAASIERCMRPGSTLFVTVPFCWPVHAYPSDYWRVTPAALEVLFPGVEWVERRLVNQTVVDGTKIKRQKIGGFPHFPRTETFGFGVLR